MVLRLWNKANTLMRLAVEEQRDDLRANAAESRESRSVSLPRGPRSGGSSRSRAGPPPQAAIADITEEAGATAELLALPPVSQSPWTSEAAQN